MEMDVHIPGLSGIPIFWSSIKSVKTKYSLLRSQLLVVFQVLPEFEMRSLFHDLWFFILDNSYELSDVFTLFVRVLLLGSVLIVFGNFVLFFR